MTTDINTILNQLSAPARRAIQSLDITTLDDLSRFSEKEIMALHGIGNSALLTIKILLQANSLDFKRELQ
jgi:hypothetical protein